MSRGQDIDPIIEQQGLSRLSLALIKFYAVSEYGLSSDAVTRWLVD